MSCSWQHHFFPLIHCPISNHHNLLLCLRHQALTQQTLHCCFCIVRECVRIIRTYKIWSFCIFVSIFLKTVISSMEFVVGVLCCLYCLWLSLSANTVVLLTAIHPCFQQQRQNFPSPQPTHITTWQKQNLCCVQFQCFLFKSSMIPRYSPICVDNFSVEIILNRTNFLNFYMHKSKVIKNFCWWLSYYCHRLIPRHH